MFFYWPPATDFLLTTDYWLLPMPEDILSIYHRSLQYDPIDEGLVARQQQMVVDIAGRDRTGAGALEIAQSALGLADRLISEYEAAQSLPQPIVCGPGCPFCCANQVELLPPEALLLGDYVARHFSPEAKQGLFARIAGNLKLRTGKTKEELAPLRPELLCPLLQDGSCSVYPARPLFCRTHHSLDVAQCRREFLAEPVAGFEFYSHRYEIMLSVRAGLQAGCQTINCQAQVLDHVAALQVCLDTPNSGERWINGEDVF
jgi:Fe-S-cluster containining protein